MTARSSRLWSTLYQTETNWGETGDTLAASGTRLQCMGEPQLNLTQSRIAEPISQQIMGAGKGGVLGPKGGTVTFRFAMTGHGTAPTGALTQTDLHALAKLLFGGGDTDAIGDTVASATSASQFVATAQTYTTRDLIRVGADGDGRCDGAWGAVNNGTTITMLTALPGTPNAADVIYAAQSLYSPQAPSTHASITSSRWLVMTSNGQWILRGCWPQSGSISAVNVGENPILEITFGITWWEATSETFPSAVATAAKDSTMCTPNCFVQDYGTVTRATHSLRSWSIDFEFNVVAEPGNNGYNAYATINGAKRLEVNASVTTMFDAEAAGTTTWLDRFTNGTFAHMLISLSTVAGKALAFYFPYCEISEAPIQESSDGLNRVSCKWRCLPDETQSTDRSRAAFIIGMG